jgi:DNA-directed RNA polymerase III subunit RPC2
MAPTEADKWKLLPAFLSARGLVKQHIDSYNYLVSRDIHQIVMAQSNRRLTSDIDPKWFAEYENVTIGAPSYMDGMSPKELTPQICRLRDMTYAAPIYVDVVYYRETEIVRKKGLKIGYIPVMLRSQICCLYKKTAAEMAALSECPLDPGGYFIVKGTERVLLMQEQLSNNRIIVELDPNHMVQAVVTSSTADNKSRTVVCFRKKGREGLFVKHSAFSDLIPLVIAIKALGMESDQEIVQMIGDNGLGKRDDSGVILSLQDAHALGVFTQVQALEYLSGKMKQRTLYYSAQKQTDEAKLGEVLDVLVRQLLSNIPITGGPGTGRMLDFTQKARYLCIMGRRCLDADVNPALLDDRDYYGNKRLELAGQLIGLLFEDLFKNFNQDIKSKTDKVLTRYLQHKANASATSRRIEPYPDAFAVVADNIITHGMQRAISSGNWNIKRFRIDRTGVSQVLSRFSFIAALGAMTRVKSQFEKSRKLAGPRALQPSEWGMLCPSDTPEGEQCGLVKHLCLMTHVTTPENDTGLLKLCYSIGGVEEASLVSGGELFGGGAKNACVFLNGSLIGVVVDAKTFVSKMRHLRRTGNLGEFVSIYIHEALNSVFIASDGGRLCRPLIVVENGKSKLDCGLHLAQLEAGKVTFQDFLSQGILEWVDVNEENDSLIAFREADITEETTHLEIEPLTLLGAVAGLIPYPHHNQSPRNTYQCAMGKQAMGAIAQNQFVRADTLLLTLVYPQKPMVKSRTIDLIGWENLPAGHNASVAVMSYSGYDIEDAIVMNKASLDRGFGRCGYFKRTSTQLESRAGVIEQLRGPPVELGRVQGSHRRGNPNPGLVRKYGSVDADGLPRIGDFVHDGAIMINKMSPIVSDTSGHTVSASSWVETNVRYKNPVPSFIDRVIWTQDESQVMNIKVITRQTRRPELGDKFSSRHGQKGVVGLIVPQQDMPFSETGWCPDLIMNPHGFPSRMTVGKMLELIAGKGGVLEGKQAYGTVFGGTPRDEICAQLIKHGFNPSGKDILYSGITGEPLECYIFSGPIYYQKLKHMVVDKIHARSTGPRQGLTRQPTEGRARDGGLRLGEMERDCLVAYGASNLLVERLMLSSDVFSAPVCKKCGLIVQNGWCSACKNGSGVVTLRLPYACKLLFQELLGMNVCPRLKIQHR